MKVSFRAMAMLNVSYSGLRSWYQLRHPFIYQTARASTTSSGKVEKCYKILNVKSDCSDDEIKVGLPRYTNHFLKY